jgi:hypothetical protein
MCCPALTRIGRRSQLHSVTVTRHAAPMGMIGFDIACVPTRSGPRIHGYLVNDPWKTISANSKRTDFALAA